MASISGYQFYTSIGSPRYVTAPMEHQSELAFRMMTRKYGSQLCYTPMFHAKHFATSEGYRDQQFSTCPEDRPLFVQFCGDNPEYLVRAAKLVENSCDAVDINFGCPQGIAKKGHYGAFLLSEPDLVCELISSMVKELSVPVTCKIRKLDDIQDTIKLVKMIEAAGCSVLTVHGRTKEQKQNMVGSVDWEIIKLIKQTVNIPVIANGGISCFEDCERCLEYTGADAVMSSMCILENPVLFSGLKLDVETQALEYLDFASQYNTADNIIRPHLFKMLHSPFYTFPDLRERLGTTKGMDNFRALVQECMDRHKAYGEIPDNSYYWRWGGNN
jgi:tRNA-dihydrouridine synthase 1